MIVIAASELRNNPAVMPNLFHCCPVKEIFDKRKGVV
jgi:hypothetical protein